MNSAQQAPQTAFAEKRVFWQTGAQVAYRRWRAGVSGMAWQEIMVAGSPSARQVVVRVRVRVVRVQRW